MRYLLSIFLLLAIVSQGFAQQHISADRTAYLDKKGTIRWSDDNKELSLFGANYCLPSACDYRAAGYVSSDRKKMVDDDMAHFARMGFDGLRLCFWGDYENSDSAGNLINNDHLDLLDYLVAKAKERGIYMLLSPIVTYSSQWPDAMQDTFSVKGFSTYFKKSELGTNPKAIKAQCNYLTQLLNHVNKYTGLALKDDPAIVFIEMINEPWHHSNDLKGSVKYINALVNAVRSTGCQKLLFHNVSQDFNISKALQQSRIQGVSFAWYPSGLNSGHQLQGNYLPVVDEYSKEMLRPELNKLGKIVYEFDSPDLLTGYMYPAMARSFRTVGAQWASIFSYDMLATAPFNLGWQTHFINMVYTPNKAISAIIAAKAMKDVPMYKDYGKYPGNTSFGSFHVDYTKNLGEMITDEEFIYSNSTQSKPSNLKTLKQIIGHGSSPIVNYPGKGIYFLDKIKDGTWRLEVYPDVVEVNDPFNMPSPGKVVRRLIRHAWPMKLSLSDLGKNFSVIPLNARNNYQTSSRDGEFFINPGVYILTADKNLEVKSLPDKIGYVKMNEFVCPEDQNLPMQVIVKTNPEYVLGQPIVLGADIYSPNFIDSATLFFKTNNARFFQAIPMKLKTGYSYEAEIPKSNMLIEGEITYCIVVNSDGQKVNFPSGLPISPSDWNYYGSDTWKSEMISSRVPLKLLIPDQDMNKLAFTRIGDNIRFGIFKTIMAGNTGNTAFHLELPLSYDHHLDDYTLSLTIKNKIIAAKSLLNKANALMVYAKGISQKQDVYLTLVEKDGTSWSKKIILTPQWNEIRIPLSELKLSRGVMLPLGYPGRWKYWFEPAEGRGGVGDKIQLENIERLQLSIRPSTDFKGEADANSYIDLAGVNLLFK